MKHKWITRIMVLIAVLSFALNGCALFSPQEEGEGVETAQRGEEDGDNRDDDGTMETEGNQLAPPEEEDSEEEDSEEKEPQVESAPDGVPVLGDTRDDYDGFEYLYAEELTTQSEENPDTGAMESESLVVYIPKGDYTYVSKETASSDNMGINLQVSIGSYALRYDYEDYSARENMEYFLESEFDPAYTAEYRMMELSEVEVIDETTARATASYVEYLEWEEDYFVRYNTYYLKEMDSGLMVMVSVEMLGEEVVDKTESVLKELEAFYGFDIEWDQAAAGQKLEAFKANPDAEPNRFAEGGLLFELPTDWKIDSEEGDYYISVIAPDGRARNSGSFVILSSEYTGEDMDMVRSLTDEELTEFVNTMLGEEMNDLTIDILGDTNIGFTIQVKGSGDFLGDDQTYQMNCYLIFSDYEIYFIMGADTEGTVGAEAATHIVETAEVA